MVGALCWVPAGCMGQNKVMVGALCWVPAGCMGHNKVMVVSAVMGVCFHKIIYKAFINGEEVFDCFGVFVDDALSG